MLRRRCRGEGTWGPPTTSTGTPQPLGGALPSAGAPSPCGASPPTWAGRSSVLQESGEAQPCHGAQWGRPHRTRCPHCSLPRCWLDKVQEQPARVGIPGSVPPRGMSQPLRALPGLTSEPFQEEIVVLRGQGGEHVLKVLPKLWGKEGAQSAGLGTWPHPSLTPQVRSLSQGQPAGPAILCSPPWQGTVPRPGAKHRVSPNRSHCARAPATCPPPPALSIPPLPSARRFWDGAGHRALIAHHRWHHRGWRGPGGTAEAWGTRCRSPGRGTTQIPWPAPYQPVTRLTGLSPPEFRCN